MIIVVIFAAIIFSVNSVIFQVTRDSSGKIPYVRETPVNLKNSPLSKFFIPQNTDLFQDVDGGNFETCNANNQKVFNGRVKGIGEWDTITHQNEYMRTGDPVILALCWDPSSKCQTGVSLIGNLDGVSQKLHFTKNSGVSAQLVLRNEKNETINQFSYLQDKFSFGCIVFSTWVGLQSFHKGDIDVSMGRDHWNTNYTQFVSYGDKECRMTLTVVDTDTHSSTKFICNAPKQELNDCKKPNWDETPTMDKDTMSINHTIDEILEGQELLLGVISVNPQLAPNPQLVAYDAAGNLFINAGYERGSVTALLPEAFQIPLQLTKTDALLSVAVCVRANSKCIKGGLSLSIGDCNMTVPAESLKPLKESQCWVGGWAVRNTRLGDGLLIKYDVPTCRMVVVITSTDIKKCQMEWEPFKIIASDSRVEKEDAISHVETLEYEQTKSYEEVWSSSNIEEKGEGGERREEDGEQHGRVDSEGTKETTYEEVTDSEKTNVQWNKENAAPMQMPGLGGSLMSMSGAQGMMNGKSDNTSIW